MEGIGGVVHDGGDSRLCMKHTLCLSPLLQSGASCSSACSAALCHHTAVHSGSSAAEQGYIHTGYAVTSLFKLSLAVIKKKNNSR